MQTMFHEVFYQDVTIYKDSKKHNHLIKIQTAKITQKDLNHNKNDRFWALYDFW